MLVTGFVRNGVLPAGPMIIFIPVFLFLFVIVPALLTWMAAPMLGIRRLPYKAILFMVITALNWEVWQAPQPTPAHQVRAP